jgi:hypothetical protein
MVGPLAAASVIRVVPCGKTKQGIWRTENEPQCCARVARNDLKQLVSH